MTLSFFMNVQYYKIVIGQKIPIEVHIIRYNYMYIYIQNNATMLLGMPPPSNTVTTRMNLRHFFGKGSPSPSLSTAGLLMILFLILLLGGGTHPMCRLCNSSTFHPPIQKVKVASSLLDFCFVHALEPQHLLSKVARQKEASRIFNIPECTPLED